MSEEHVLVIPAGLIDSIGPLSGFERDVDRYLLPILASDQLSYRPRSQMELDPNFKQLIPYVILQWIDPADGQPKIFTYTRGGGGGEARLHAKRSIGIGGHISHADSLIVGGNVYEIGMRRELDEEVTIESSYTESREGLLYDPSSDVGRVHLGVIHRFILQQPTVRSNEPELAEGEFLTLPQLRLQYQSLETWSQLCLDEMFTD